MDEFFLRELAIFIGVLAVFIGSVPLLLRGHHGTPIDSTLEGVSVAGANDDGGESSGGTRVSRKRKARARDAGRNA